jgi:putative transposase
MQRKRYSAEFKAKVAVEAIRGLKTAHEIAREHGVHPTMVALWKKQALESMPEVFSKNGSGRGEVDEGLIARLYEQIGRQQTELDWLKKKSGYPA